MIPIPAEMMCKTNIAVLRVERDSMIGDHVLNGDHLILENPSPLAMETWWWHCSETTRPLSRNFTAMDTG